MARPAFTDYLQAFPFWMMDSAPITPNAAPIFNPVLGFSSITSPEITVEQYTIRQANWFFEKHVVQRGSISPFTVRRGVTFFDSDFWRWVNAGLSGNVAISVGGSSYRRNFVLIHFFARNPLAGLTGKPVPTEGTALNFGPFEFALRVPAKAYWLKGCIPARWKSGNDFDAMDGSVSIAELDFTCELVEEVSLGSAINPAIGVAVSAASTGIGAIASTLTPGPP